MRTRASSLGWLGTPFWPDADYGLRILLQDQQSRRFLLLSAAFVVLMQVSCIIEEHIYVALPGFKGFFWTVAFAELLFFAAAAMFRRCREHGLLGSLRDRQAPMSLYVAMASALGLSQALGKIVNRYLNYATGTIIKSAKLVPTLLISVLWLRRKVSSVEWLAASLLVISSALMALGEKAVEPKFDPVGLPVAAFQLLLAALQGNLQERALKDHGASISEAMAFSNGLGLIVVLVGMQVSGESSSAAAFFLTSPLALLLLVVRSATFFLAALALTALTKEHGTGAATAVGTARKSLTVLMSFLLFPKPVHVNYVLGTVAFLAADLIYLRVSSAKAAERKLGGCTPETTANRELAATPGRPDFKHVV